MDTTKTAFRANSYYTEDAVKYDGYLYVCRSTKGYWWLDQLVPAGRDRCDQCGETTRLMLERYDGQGPLHKSGLSNHNTLFCTDCAPALEKTTYRFA